MNSKEFPVVGLYEHNAYSYKKIKAAFETGERVVGIVHATGTGKTYNALQLAIDNKDKKIVYVVPSNGIIEHIKKIIENNPKLDMQNDFANLEFRTYHSFISLDRKEIENIDCDLLILDEFHHIGAPIWGARIKTMIETHPEMKIFGMTAYTVRDRGTSYERDMANPDTNELFSNKIESRYDLCDAMIDGVLPKPVYKSAYINLLGVESKLEERVKRLDASTKEYREYMSILFNVKKRIHEAPSIPNILRKNIKPNGKYIYFCPPCAEEGTNDIETIKNQAFNWFKQFVPEEDIIIYTSTSKKGDDGKNNREAFYNDITLDGKKVDNKLRVMFAINQYNEGIHAPNIDGVIMGRGTTSDIVYFEQLGRALAIRGNTKEMFDELEEYSIEELMEMCKRRDIPIKENISKEELIEKLIAPVVIDLTNNYDFIKELENNLRDRIKEIQNYGLGNHRNVKIKDASFDIEIENQDLFEMLKYVSDRLTMTWEDYYELAKVYYKHHGDLEVPSRFKTSDGYTFDKNGTINLGMWIVTQRKNCDPESERGEKLTDIGMRWKNKISTLSWEEMYEYAKIYYNFNHNLEVPAKFKTKDGYTYDENGTIKLGQWIVTQRINCVPESKRGEKLTEIGMRWKNKISNLSWEEMYKYAKAYYNFYHNLEVPYKFKTNNGYSYDENGTINLGKWIATQRRNCDLESERGKKLTNIGMCWENKISTLSWEEMYEYAKIYYNFYHNLEVLKNFKTNDGYTYDENGTINLGNWIATQRRNCDLESERGEKLTNIGMCWENKISNLSWEEMYKYAKIYYKFNHNLEIPSKFKTNDGYTYDENGTIKLGQWIATQRISCNQESERGKKLTEIEMRWENKRNILTWEEMYEYAKAYYNFYHNLEIQARFKTNNGYTYAENGTINLGTWLVTQRRICNPESEQGKKLTAIGMRWENMRNILPWEEMYEYAKAYYNFYHNLKVPAQFKTNNGYTYDENGTINLGNWIYHQRRICNPENEQGQLLSIIGMVWDIKKNKNEIIEVCEEYNIDYSLNKTILKHISIQEFQSKIKFLKEHNISIVDNKGLLIDIFSMSSLDMKEKYGFYLEEIITYYTTKKRNQGG